jgi:hypothetical protein
MLPATPYDWLTSRVMKVSKSAFRVAFAFSKLAAFALGTARMVPCRARCQFLSTTRASAGSQTAN